MTGDLIREASGRSTLAAGPDKPAAEPSDAALLAAWRAGDDGAFATMVERYQSPLLRHARSLLGTRGPLEDVVQETFLRLARSGPEISPAALEKSPERPLASWLHTVTRNLCMDALRSDSRRRERERELATGEEHDGGLDAVEGRDVRERVERELERLPADQREVLVLRLLGEHSYKEIAEITGRKIGTVGWLVSVGLKELGQRLENLLPGGRSMSADLAPRGL